MASKRRFDLSQLRRDVEEDERFQQQREAEITEDRKLSHEEIQRLVRQRRKDAQRNS